MLSALFNNRWLFKILLTISLVIIGGLAFMKGVSTPVNNDKLEHFCAFVALAFLAHHALRAGFWQQMALLGCYGGFIEIVQYYLPYRESALNDFMADLAGVCSYHAAYQVHRWYLTNHFRVDEDGVDTPHIAIVGPGAIGRLIAAHAVSEGLAVTLIGRNGPLDAHSFQFQGLTGTQPRAIRINPAQRGTASLLVVTTKAYQAVDAIAQAVPYVNRECGILLLHNGLGTHETIAARHPTHPLLIGTTTHGAYIADNQTVVHSGAGETWIGQPRSGPLPDPVRRAINALAETFMPTSWRDEIMVLLWRKLAINAVINPLTALSQLQNGTLAQPEWRPTVDALLDEIGALYHAMALPLSDAEIRTAVWQTIAQTAANFSSMNRDRAAGRPTEIDQITGVLLGHAARCGVAMPQHQALYTQLKQ